MKNGACGRRFCYRGPSGDMTGHSACLHSDNYGGSGHPQATDLADICPFQPLPLICIKLEPRWLFYGQDWCWWNV